MTVPDTPLNDGHAIPQLGFGTGQMTPTETVESVAAAIEIGYRHIDTAQMYGNEREVGEGIRRAGVAVEDVFITSKLDNGFHRPAEARASFGRTLERIGVERIDLFLIHWPVPMHYDGDYVGTWLTLEELRGEGRIRSIGVSNFELPHLERLRRESGTIPAVNQVELHPTFQNRAVHDYNNRAGIVTEAWSPLGDGEDLGDSEIERIAGRLGRSPAQVVLRWHLQRGHVVFPKSSNRSRIEENFSVLDFALEGDDLAAIDSLDRGERGRVGEHPQWMDDLGA